MCAIGRDEVVNVMVLTTGGTIEKRYDELDGSLQNRQSPIRAILSRLRLPATTVRHHSVMRKDSLDMTARDRQRIASAVRRVPESYDAVVIVHGTDTLSTTGDYLCETLGNLSRPIVLTGALRPYEFSDTDAFQNVVEALLVCRLLPPGVYLAMHNKVLQFPGVRKCRETKTFVGSQSAVGS